MLSSSLKVCVGAFTLSFCSGLPSEHGAVGWGRERGKRGFVQVFLLNMGLWGGAVGWGRERGNRGGGVLQAGLPRRVLRSLTLP